MLHAILERIFGCSHRSTSFPLTPSRKVAREFNRHGTYVVCLECGKEFGYDWNAMRIGDPVAPASAHVRTSLLTAAHLK